MSMSDEELVMLVQATRDASGFGELARRHQAGLRIFLRRLSGDFDRADDLAQEALLKAFNGIGRFRRDARFKTWLYRIGYREFLQSARREARRRQAHMEFEAAAEHQPPPAGPDGALDLSRAMAGLGDGEKAAILLCDALGLTNEEAAKVMDAPLGTVKTYVRRGRERLREAMTAETAAGDGKPAGEPSAGGGA